ncbi:MAG: DNA (cytosine-5-)-methyltransferase [Cyanobacteria bacterium]|jgi:DNA (cytosine-5)-methyltransferase 1|nr:DNA (cytosine-5-)-methyltransferase [Cyanobacteria bacterium GSL.Bin1]
MNKKFIDLFSGAGGMSCGLEMAGFQCLLGVDHDAIAIETFQINHQNAKTIIGDLREISIEKIQEAVGYQKIDLICGGPPCQGFSTIGQNNHQDQRNFLFWDFLRIIKSLCPDYVIMENVTGLLSRRNEPTLKVILDSFTKIGYRVDIKVLSAHHYGVPEKRRRTILLANRFQVTNLYPEILFTDSEEGEDNLSLPRTVDWAFNHLKTDNNQILNHDLEKAQITNSLEKKRLSYIPEGGSIRYEKDQKAYLPPELWFDIDWDKLLERRFREAKLRRLDRAACAGTINTSRTTFYHPTEDRYLTAREAAAIQSFPANYVFCGTVTQQWRQIGNAVPPLMAKAIGQAILQLDQEKENMEKAIDFPKIDSVRANAFTYRKPKNETSQLVQLELF